jgi:predicted RNase H-like HicB family nuclease
MAELVKKLIVVRATWDPEASVWVATSDDLPGLVAEADTFEALTTRVPGIITDLLEANGVTSDWPDVPVHIVAERSTRALVPASG